MKRIIVSEKPSMGRAIASALGIQGTGRNFIESNDVIVTWCVGHLVSPIDPEGYDPEFKSWRLDTIPIFPAPFRYAPITATRDQYEVVAKLINRDDVVDVVDACDPGREGTLIFSLTYALSGCKKPVKRLWASSLTDKAIQEAYGKMKPEEAYRGLRDAAYSRQEADWLVGINCTRAQTLIMQRAGGEGVYSIGRVQTPTLALLVNRELEITDFVPKNFWTLIATFQANGGAYKGKWFQNVDGKDQDRFDKEEDAKALSHKLAGQPGKVASVTSKTIKMKPELLYDLTNLQKEANRRFGFTAENTLKIAQDLYEAKLMSYPRTNSRYLTEADAVKAPGWIKSIAQGQLAELQPFVAELRKRWPVTLPSRFVDDAQVEDHAALVPTENPAKNLQGDQLKIYDLVARLFWPLISLIV
jgi:DNA topoisomerase-3